MTILCMLREVDNQDGNIIRFITVVVCTIYTLSHGWVVFLLFVHLSVTVLLLLKCNYASVFY